MDAELKSKFLALDRPKKLEFLAWLIHRLTVRARDYAYTREYPTEIRLVHLRDINEVIHVASSKIGGLLTGTPKQYPDDVFFDILIERAGKEGAFDLEIALREEFERAEYFAAAVSKAD